MTTQSSQWAETTWDQLVRSRGRRNRKRGAGIVFILACLAGLVFLAFTCRSRVGKLPILTIHEIEIAGNRTVPSAEIIDILCVRAQDPWWRCKPDEIRARASRHPRVASLDLRYSWYHRLVVGVVEREPALTVFGGIAGEVTRDGWFLPPEAAGDEPDLPILRPAPGTLPSPGSQVDRRTAAVARLMGDLRTRNLPVWRDLSEIDLAGSAAEARAYLRSRRAVILFVPGIHDDLWARLPEVLEDLERKDRNDVVLDLRFQDRIVVHLPEAVPADSADVASASAPDRT